MQEVSVTLSLWSREWNTAMLMQMNQLSDILQSRVQREASLILSQEAFIKIL